MRPKHVCQCPSLCGSIPVKLSQWGVCVSHPSSIKHKHTRPASLAHAIFPCLLVPDAHTLCSPSVALSSSSSNILPLPPLPPLACFSSPPSPPPPQFSTPVHHIVSRLFIFLHFLCPAPCAPYTPSSFLPRFLWAPLSPRDVTFSTDSGAAASKLGAELAEDVHSLAVVSMFRVWLWHAAHKQTPQTEMNPICCLCLYHPMDKMWHICCLAKIPRPLITVH